MHDLYGAMTTACRNVGVFPPGALPDVGKWAEADIDGDTHGKGDARIKLFPDGEGGIVHNWKSGEQQVFFADNIKALTPEQRAARHQAIEAARIRAEAELQTERKQAASKAAAIWKAAKPAPENNPYLTRKGIKASGARLHNDALVIPMRAGGEIHSLQFIGPDGDKRFLTGGRVAGCYFSIGNPKGAAALCIAEGFATGATIHEATGYPVAVAFNAGNLGPVAKGMRERFTELPLILCADDDLATPGNPGMMKATEAARSVGALLAIPAFGADRPNKATDFNDMAKLCGVEAVKQAIANASAPAMLAHLPGDKHALEGGFDGWQEPQPLAAKVEPEAYPLDALPDAIRAAVEEVQAFTKAPIPMVASSALAALSLAIQAHADVKRADKLSGPVGLFLLTIADSGERKSTCDGFFTTAIRDYQAQQAEAAKPERAEHRAALAAWEAKRAGLVDAIKQGAKSGTATGDKERDLREHEQDKPEPPRVPKLLRGDDTPENLAFVMSREWPSAGAISAEAGIIFGAHGMGKDSIMRNLALLNILWDGGTLDIGRRTSESFAVKGARLTMALQVQEATLREFFKQSGALARGTGFLARFLVAWPESTQGFRQFSEAPANWPHLAAFNRRIDAILNQPAPINEDGSLSPPLLSLTTDAKAAWVAFHDAIEGELASGGELYDVRDVASKSADNAARLAALFQIFEGAGGAIGADAFEGASRIAAWHLNEARRFFGELALPPELADAARLDTWLTDYCRREKTHLVPIAKLQQFGPGGLRSKATIETAVRELEDSGRARLVREGKRKMIAVNPALLTERGAS